MASEKGGHGPIEHGTTPSITGPLSPPYEAARATSKGVKRRAAFACLSCRSRKVRCDVTASGGPCSNCRWDYIECVVRKRQKHLMMPNENEPSHIHLDNRLASKVCESQSDSGIGPSPAPSLLDAPRTGFSPFFTSLSFQSLPSFIKPLPSTIDQQDMEFLQNKGALSLPTTKLQKALLDAYIEFIHPARPVLDLKQLIPIIQSDDSSSGHFSLLLYHALLSASAGFVDPMLLQNAGYSSKREAREAFFYKFRLLYDLDCESDAEVVIQALLLIISWPEPHASQDGTQDRASNWKDSWYWMGIVISLAYRLCLHDESVNKLFSISIQKRRKRIWWCCFMLDSLTSLALRRPPRIIIESIDMPTLEASDIDSGEYLEEITTFSCTLDKDRKHVSTTRPELVELLLQKTRLCVLVSHLLRLSYSSAARKANWSTNDTVALSLNLAEWAERLPSTCQYHLIAKQDPDINSSIILQRFILQMIYYIMLVSLQHFLSLSKPQALPRHRNASRRCVRECVRRVGKMISNMCQNKQGLLLPGTDVSGLLHTLTRVIDDIVEGQDEESWAESDFGFQACIQALDGIQDIHAGPEFLTAGSDVAVGDLSLNWNDIMEISSIKSPQVTLEDLYYSLGEPMEDMRTETDSSSGHGDLILEDLLYLSSEG